MRPIRCLIVDDEALARERLCRLLEPETSFVIQAVLGEGRQALEQCLIEPPELVFLDVKMPAFDGMQFLAAINEGLESERRPYVILVTAFDRYALQAFEYQALDYLVKPFDDERFAASLSRARERVRGRRASRIIEEHESPSDRHQLHLRVGNKDRWIDAREIIWVEAADHYLYVHLAERSHLVRMTMSAMERELASLKFLRAHRGALVNPRFIVEVGPRAAGGRNLTLREGSSIPVSRRRWTDVRDRLQLGSAPD